MRAALGFEFPGEVVGQFDYTVALRLVGVVVGHVQGEVGQDLVAVHVLHQLHHSIEDGPEDRLRQLGTVGHLSLAKPVE